MFCPECGCKIEEDALFCSECGTKLEEPSEQQQSLIKKGCIGKSDAYTYGIILTNVN